MSALIRYNESRTKYEVELPDCDDTYEGDVPEAGLPVVITDDDLNSYLVTFDSPPEGLTANIVYSLDPEETDVEVGELGDVEDDDDEDAEEDE